MKFVTISIKCTLPEAPVVLTKNSDNRLLLKKAASEVQLSTLDTKNDHILTDIGSSIGNVIFIIDNEFQIDPLLAGNIEQGVFEFKEPEQITEIDVTRTFLGTEEVLSYHFDNMITARRFIDKKIFGEFYFLKSENDQFVFYPQFKEAFLITSNAIEVGFLGLLDCENNLSAPTAAITELAVEPTDKKVYKIANTDVLFELPIWKKYRLDFTPGSGMHIIRMIRGNGEVKNKNGNRYWKPQDEILKIHVCEG